MLAGYILVSVCVCVCPCVCTVVNGSLDLAARAARCMLFHLTRPQLTRGVRVLKRLKITEHSDCFASQAAIHLGQQLLLGVGALLSLKLTC
jgi:hypothetical protein